MPDVYDEIDESVGNKADEPHIGAEDLDVPLRELVPTESVGLPPGGSFADFSDLEIPFVDHTPPPEVQELLKAKNKPVAPGDKDKIDRLSAHEGEPEDRLHFLEEEFAELLVRLHLHGI
jgi:hypothetical protein